MKRSTICVALLLIATALPAAAQLQGNTERPPAAPERWAPFKPLENSTFRVTTDPAARATYNQEFTWELEWRPERHIYPGTQIELRSLSLRTYLSWGYTKEEVYGGDVTFRRRAEVSPSELFALQGNYAIVRATLQYGLRAGDRLRIRLTAVPPLIAGLFDAVSLWYAEPSVGSEEVKSPKFVRDPRAQAILKVGAAHVERLMVYSHPMPGADGKVRTLLAPQDLFGNAAELVNPLPVQLTWKGKTWTEEVRAAKVIVLDPPENIGRLRLTVSAKLLFPLDNISNGRRAGDTLEVTGNPVWRESPDGEMAAFGEFHWHTEASGDGGRSLPEGLAYARDHLNLDYVAPSDHKPSAAQWKYQTATLDASNRPGEFATFFGWEHSTNRGHENYYFTDPQHPVSPVGAAGASLGGMDDLTQLPEALSKYDVPGGHFIAVPHHTNAPSETHRLSDDTPYWFQFPWTHQALCQRLVEIIQIRGNQERDEYPDDAWRGWYAGRASVQEGLAHDYKLGFTGGTDNHTAMPGSTTDYGESMARIPLGSISLTGLWTKRIERQAVFDALYDRHTWAVWSTRALVYFAINGTRSGDELRIKKGESLTAHIKMSAEDSLRSIEIVAERIPVWTGTNDELDFDLNVPLPPASHSTYFYLRALQRDGGIIYSSPVFMTVE